MAGLLLLAAAGCGGATTSPATTEAPGDQAWERVVPGGDCRCSDGSEFSFWVRRGNPKKVLFYLQDGGACFSARTCARDSELYNIRVDEGPTGEGGIFDYTAKRNPFADYSVVFVPYCTADVHIGNVTRTYAPGLTIHHKGYVNGTAALDRLAATFPEATEVAVVGESAGSVAAPLYGGLVSDRLPGARVTVIADGSGSYPDQRRFNEIIAGWGMGRWSFPGLFIRSERQHPKIVLARHDYAYDDHQAIWYPIAGVPAKDLLERIDANETQIERAGVNLLSYIAPGTGHTALTEDQLYTEEVNGRSLLDWVTALIEGEPVADVHCKECRAG